MSSILVVNPDGDERKAMSEALISRGAQVGTAGSIQGAMQALAEDDFERVISIRSLPDGSGELLVQQAAEISPRTEVVLVTNFTQVRTPSDLLRFDFTDYILDADILAGLVAGRPQGPGPGQRSIIECFLRTVEVVVGLVELQHPMATGNAAAAMRLALGLAREMGLKEEQRQEVALAALLRDIGNFTLRPQVLKKKKALSPEEDEQIRQHTVRGVELLDHIDFPWKLKPIILQHHERYDGTGYPEGKKGRSIPIGARILAVVDSYLAMTTDRPHRQPVSHDEAMAVIRGNMGTQFDPEVVEGFTALVERRKKFAGDLFQIQILVLEDEAQSLPRLKLHFQREDFTVLSAASAQEAVAIVQKESVRFVVMDVTRLWDDGLFLLDRLQERIDRSHTDVLLLDGQLSRERRLQALDGGAEEVFPLEVGMAEVVSRMRRILRREEAVRRDTTLAKEGGIEGELSEMDLPDIVQMLSLGQKTARVMLTSEEGGGQLFLESGRLMHAEAGKVEGEEAVASLLCLRSGRFRIFHGQTSPKRSVDREAMSLLLDLVRAMDEDSRSAEIQAR